MDQETPLASSLARSLISLVIPPACLNCGRAVAVNRCLCSNCRQNQPVLRTDCKHCALPGHHSAQCRQPIADHIESGFRYEGVARKIVKTQKYHPSRLLARQMAESLVAGLDIASWPRDLVVVPVPARRGRRHRRSAVAGVELLARALADQLDSPYADNLQRFGGDVAQVGRDRSERLLDGPHFRAVSMPSGRVLVVDDVCTTGATLRASVDALRDVGVTMVIAMTYARAL